MPGDLRTLEPLQAKLMPMLATCYALNFAKNKVRPAAEPCQG